MDFDEENFHRVYDQHKKGMESSEADQLKFQVRYLLNSVLCPRSFSRPDRLRALSAVTLEDVRLFAHAFRVACAVECLFFGNVSRAQAQQMGDVIIGN